jgi:hypothetical protein
VSERLAGPKPRAEVLVEGELSPFEHEALYQILKKKFLVDQPGYTELPDEDLATRVNIVFHHAYSPELFTTVLQESWRDLKELFKQVRHRRGKIGAAFNFTFAGNDTRLVFRSGPLDYEAIGSALDQIGHLTSIIRQMLRPGAMSEPLGLIECSFDKVSDRWHGFLGFSTTDQRRVYSFDEADFKWTLQKT